MLEHFSIKKLVSAEWLINTIFQSKKQLEYLAKHVRVKNNNHEIREVFFYNLTPKQIWYSVDSSTVLHAFNWPWYLLVAKMKGINIRVEQTSSLFSFPLYFEHTPLKICQHTERHGFLFTATTITGVAKSTSRLVDEIYKIVMKIKSLVIFYFYRVLQFKF